MEATLEQRHLDACRGGDAGAYRALVDAYWGRAVGLAHGLVGNAEDARDIAQDAFVAAYRAMPRHQAGAPFYPWLRGILVNRARMFLRSRRRANARRDRAATWPGHWAAPRDEVSGDGSAVDLVRTALSRLDAESRALVILKHVEDYTYDELSAALGIPAGTVMSRLFRARRQLREIIEELSPALLAAGSAEEER